MTMTAGTQFNHYTILGPLGAGGMGEVYRATDNKLKREVALKVLPPDFATDADRLARFQREAELLAALNHNNIAQIHGIESAGGITALIMELIEGPTLAERIEQGPFPPDEALNIALQICAALEAAHERGIVHRDLKPANIKLKNDGTVKVLDFGIAKAVEANHSSGRHSPTMVTPAVTESGVIMGTAAYMSPEQVRGKAVDARTDIWAFGCVLYEMLTGQPAFGGEDVMTTLARVLDRDTDMNSIPGTISPAVRHTIKLCLRKDPKKRVADIRDVRLALVGEFETVFSSPAAVATVIHPLWKRVLPLAGTATVALIVGGLAVFLLLRPPPQPVNRFSYALPATHTLRNTDRNVLAFSPSGRHFVYNTSQGLYLRTLGELEARLIRGTEETLKNPFFSPDGQAIAYWSVNDRKLKRIAISGGAPVVIADVANNLTGASWTHDDTILFGQENGGIYQVAARGGTPQLIIENQDGRYFGNPVMLPDGDTVLYTKGPVPGEIHARTLSTGASTLLIEGGGDAHYLSSGHLVYALRDGTLLAVAFDPAMLTISGGPVPLVQGILISTLTGSANYAVSANGTLVYLVSDVMRQTTLVWVNREGSEEAIAIEPSNYIYPRIAPDGKRVALDDRNTANDLWVWDFSAATRTRLTVGETGGSYGIWTADGTRIAYAPVNAKTMGLKAANNTGQITSVSDYIATGGGDPSPYFFSPSGEALVFRNGGTAFTNDDIGMITVGSAAEPVWLLREPYIERNAELSPDGRWMAYQSDESGQFEIYVRPFPNVDDDRVQVSNAGGMKPLWSRDGRELFYLEADASAKVRMMALTLEPGAENFAFGTRSAILDWPYINYGHGRDYDVSLDGQRFLAIKSVSNTWHGEATAPQIIIVENWVEELKRLVPVE
jgi:eukaryotic-like serine/threonine-protein kinase